MEEVLQTLLQGALFDSDVKSITWKMVGIAEILAPTFFLINLGYNYASTAIRNLGKSPNVFRIEELVRTMVLMGLLAIYVPVFSWVGSFANIINEATLPNQEISENRKVHLKFNKEIVLNKSSEDLSTTEKSTEDVSNTTEVENNEFSVLDLFSGKIGLFDLFTAAINSIGIVFIGIIRLVVQTFSIILSKFFFILGPLAITFSILPNQKDKIGQWFNVYLNVLFIGTTCNIIDTIAYSNFISSINGDHDSLIFSTLAFNSVLIVIYLLSYWLTSFYVGSSGAGKVLSTAVTAASSLATAGLASGASVASQASSGTLGNVASAGKNVIEKN